MALRKFILAGVPEQVNIPILLGLEHHLFRKYGVELEYKIVPEVHSLFMIPLIFFVVQFLLSVVLHNSYSSYYRTIMLISIYGRARVCYLIN